MCGGCKTCGDETLARSEEAWRDYEAFVRVEEHGASGRLFVCSVATSSKTGLRRLLIGPVPVVESVCRSVACAFGTRKR